MYISKNIVNCCKLALRIAMLFLSMLIPNAYYHLPDPGSILKDPVGVGP